MGRATGAGRHAQGKRAQGNTRKENGQGFLPVKKTDSF